MNKKIITLSALIFAGYLCIFPHPAKAVIPPDFIFNIGTQIAQFFSIVAILFTAVLGTFFQFFKVRFHAVKHKATVLILTILVIVTASATSAYFYAQYRQKVEYQKWLAESQQNTASTGADKNDQLHIGNQNNQNIDTSKNKFVSNIKVNDASAEFITTYYKNIAEGNINDAYMVSRGGVSYETFKSWYANTTKITLDKLVRIDDKKSSIELTLYEGDTFTRYGVIMTLLMSGTKPVRIEYSEIRILAQGSITNNNIIINNDAINQEYSFFTKNQSQNIVITNQEFKNVTDSVRSDYIVLDAREDIEYENGYFPGSIHIRFADLKAGQWIELPKDKFVYVACWSGIRGKEVAELLRTKRIVASYLENGVSGWVDFGGKWIGGINFSEKYTDPKYQVVFNTDEVKSKVKEGVILVDSREPYKFNQSHIAGSINIPIMYTPTIDLTKAFGQVPANSKVITVCDEYVNCFDAKITGVELERRGNQFLGRYNKPWEYGN